MKCNLFDSLRVEIVVNFKHFYYYDPSRDQDQEWCRDERATRLGSEKDGPALEKCLKNLGFKIYKGET